MLRMSWRSKAASPPPRNLMRSFSFCNQCCGFNPPTRYKFYLHWFHQQSSHLASTWRAGRTMRLRRERAWLGSVMIIICCHRVILMLVLATPRNRNLDAGDTDCLSRDLTFCCNRLTLRFGCVFWHIRFHCSEPLLLHFGIFYYTKMASANWSFCTSQKVLFWTVKIICEKRETKLHASICHCDHHFVFMPSMIHAIIASFRETLYTRPCEQNLINR